MMILLSFFKFVLLLSVERYACARTLDVAVLALTAIYVLTSSGYTCNVSDAQFECILYL